MLWKFTWLIIIQLPLLVYGQPAANPYKADFEHLWKTIDEQYCYWDKKQTDWQKVKKRFLPEIDTVTTKRSFLLLLERVFYELYDHHASLSMNTMESQRLVPSGADIWAEYIDGLPFITELRIGFGAEKSGLRPGMQIVAYNDQPIEMAIKSLFANSLKKDDVESKNYALRLLLAGKHSEERKITVLSGNRSVHFFPDEPVNFLKDHKYSGDIESKIYEGNIGYIKINNRLWDNNLITLFDSVLSSVSKTKSLILDLRETPGGGNTTVARSIIGRFINKEGFYQKHELPGEEKMFGVKRSWVEIVSPKPPVYNGKLVVLCGRWTGSVGEGIVIGFDALKRATIIGTRMAGLNGAIYSFQLPNSGIGFSIPAEKLFHVNNTPREFFTPAMQVDITRQQSGQDMVLDKALYFLTKSKIQTRKNK